MLSSYIVIEEYRCVIIKQHEQDEQPIGAEVYDVIYRAGHYWKYRFSPELECLTLCIISAVTHTF